MENFDLESTITESDTETESQDEQSDTETSSEMSITSDDEDDENDDEVEIESNPPLPRKRVRTRGGLANQLPRSENNNTNGDQNEWIRGLFVPDIPPFAAKPGPTTDIADDASILDVFRILVPDAIFQMIADQTNLYAQQVLAQGGLKRKSRAKEWKPLTVQELKNFVALTI